MKFLQKPYEFSSVTQQWLIVLIGSLFFLPMLGHVHLFDWDEVNFAESSREMLTSGDWFHVQINYQPFWEKPPLFMWLQSLSMALFGVNEFAARFPNALFGIITLLVLYRIGSKERGHSFGLTWALIYAGSLLPHMYFRSGIIDPVFNFFIFLSVFHLAKNLETRKKHHAAYSGLLAGLAILTKGPVGLLLVVLTYAVYVIWKKGKVWGDAISIVLFTFSCAVISLIWVLPEISSNGWAVLGDFITYQIRLLTTGDAGHEQPFFYHFVVVFIGCFPMSVLALRAFRVNSHLEKDEMARWMRILFWVVMILFTIVKTKIVHYSSMCWLPLSFLAACELQKMDQETMRKWVRIFFLVFGIILSVALITVPLLMINKTSWMHLVKDRFAQASMQVDVAWNMGDLLPGVLLLLGIVAGFLLLKNAKWKSFVVHQSLLMFAVLQWTNVSVLPKIEAHSQRPAIEFFEELSGKKVYVMPIGYKSYAQWYYFKVPQENNAIRLDEERLLYGEIDRPVYFICKQQHDFLDQKTHIKKIGEKGGFKFYLREPGSH